jgi:hypothetical protein
MLLSGLALSVTMPCCTLPTHPLRAGASPGTPLERGEAFEVKAPGVDGLCERARDELVHRGDPVHVVSFTPGGMAAYVEAPP